MRSSILVALFGLAALSAIQASASTDFNFAADPTNASNSFGNSLSYTVGGIGVTVTAWSLSSTAGSTKFATAAADNYNGSTLGLGVCSANDPSGASCSSPYHQVDNTNSTNTLSTNAPDEFLLFTFTTPVDINSLQIANYEAIAGYTNVNLSYYTTSTSLSTSTTLASLGTGTNVSNSDPGSGQQVTDTITNANDVTYLLVGASVADATASGGPIDSFKLNALSVSAYTNGGGVSPTPEPATFGLLGSALLGLGFVARKRKSGEAKQSW